MNTGRSFITHPVLLPNTSPFITPNSLLHLSGTPLHFSIGVPLIFWEADDVLNCKEMR